MALNIRPFSTADTEPVIALSLAAWDPVFRKLEPSVPGYVYAAFYPEGWSARQEMDIRAALQESPEHAWVAELDDRLVGYIILRHHPEDQMGEVYVLAVHPEAQRQGVGQALLDHSQTIFASWGAKIAMVETGGDPGHSPSRATYEAAGFERWPVARYFRKV